MSRRIALIHAHPIAMQPVADAFARDWPEADRANILDDALFYDRGKSETLSKELFDRIVWLAGYARDSGAEGILYSCSAFGEAIEQVQRTYAMPVLKPNEAMFEAALAHGDRVGMLATAGFAAEGLAQEFRQLAEARGRKADIATHVVADAMDALTRGETDTHNALIAADAHHLADCDVIMLAHFSTSRAADAVAAKVNRPVLTAPGAAVAKLKTALGA